MTYRKYILTKLGVSISVIAMLLMSISAFTIAQQTGLIDRTQKELKTYMQTGKLTSAGARIEMWKFSLDTFLQYPVFGADTKYRELQTQEGKYILFNNGIGRYAHSHNEILNVLAKKGILGFISLSIIWLLPIALIRKGYSELNSASLNLLVLTSAAWFISGMTQVHSHHVSGVTLLPLIYSLCITCSNKLPHQATSHS